MTTASTRNLGIDLLRGALALVVVAYHYGYYGPYNGRVAAEAAGHWLAYGRFAVSVFFIISGYVIAYSAVSKDWRRFSASRVARLLPAALVCSTLTYLLVLLVGVEKPIESWIGSSLLLPLLASVHLRIDASYWSIEVELIFYILVASLLLLNARVSLLVVMTFVAVSGYIAETLLGVQSRFVMFPHAAFFALGIAVFHLRNDEAAGARLAAVLLMINLVIAGMGVFIEFERIDLYDGVRSAPFVGFVIAAVALAAFMIAESARVPSAFARLAFYSGGISYPLYLLHQEAGYAAISGLSSWMSLDAARVVVVLGMVMTSLMIFLMVERPLAPVLKRGLTSRGMEKIGR